MRAIISVVGKDTVGILAKVSALCAANQVNVVDVTQTILQDMFVMIMMVDISGMTVPFSDFSDSVTAYGKDAGLVIHVMHEDIFNSMHTI
jgi:ACT domain-containing protein